MANGHQSGRERWRAMLSSSPRSPLTPSQLHIYAKRSGCSLETSSKSGACSSRNGSTLTMRPSRVTGSTFICSVAECDLQVQSSWWSVDGGWWSVAIVHRPSSVVCATRIKAKHPLGRAGVWLQGRSEEPCGVRHDLLRLNYYDERPLRFITGL